MTGDGPREAAVAARRGAVGVRDKRPARKPAGGRSPQGDLERQKIRHDIHHELATIMLLASVVRSASDVGPASRARAEHLLGEARWLEQLLGAYDDTTRTDTSRWSLPVERVRLDALALEVLAAWQLTSRVRASVDLAEAWAYVNRLMLWRALRNVVDNAYRAVGPVGAVQVRVVVEDGWSVVQVDDDGPGFGAALPSLASLGLGIVHDFVTEFGGAVEMGSGELGGGCVRILLPPSAPVPPASGAHGAGPAL
jgi:signal transduction histidine kinase